MEIIQFNGTSVTSLFGVARDRAPPRVLESAKAVVDRYKFIGFPKLDELFSDKHIFQNGVFNDVAIDAFEVYNDGLIVRGRCESDILDAFLADVLDWFIEFAGGRRVETHAININYESNLTIQSDENLTGALDQLDSVRVLLKKLVKSTNGADVEFYPFGLSLAPEDAKLVGLRPSPFRIERKLGLEYERGYFVTSAPLRTKDHVRVLEQLARAARA